jgi:hypothetical protein
LSRKKDVGGIFESKREMDKSFNIKILLKQGTHHVHTDKYNIYVYIIEDRKTERESTRKRIRESELT